MALIYSVCRCFNKPVLHRVNIYKNGKHINIYKNGYIKLESYRILDKDFANELAAGNINMKGRGRENNFPLLKMVCKLYFYFISKHVACCKIIVHTKGNSQYKFPINYISII